MMKPVIPIIETKLIPPFVKKNVIHRQKLMRKMHNISKHPLTIVHAGAGYGKSTALSLYMNSFQKNCCWYTIDINDDDIIPFITHVVYAIKKCFEDFGEELLAYMNNLTSFIRDGEIQILHALFIKELSAINEETYLVLDDYHLVDHSFSINQWIEKTIEHLPNHVHIIISSRTKPKLDPLITKWKVTGKLLEIDKNDLALEKDEVELFFDENNNGNLTEKQLSSIYELTEGWVISVSLIAEQVKNGAQLDAILNYQHTSMDDLFHYLALEVLAKQTPIMQSFIEQVAVLEEISPELCNEILGVPGSEALLEKLVESNAFMMKISNHQYRFHALFKAAIERKVKEEQIQLYKQLNEKAARYYEKQKNWELAISHLEKIQNYDWIAAILNEGADDLLKNGKLEKLAGYLKTIPDEFKRKYLSLLFYEGEVQRYLAYYEKAKNCYLELIEHAEMAGTSFLTAKAYEGLAKIYIDTIQPVVAERYLLKAIKLLEKYKGKDDVETIEIYGLMAENLINSGQAKKAEKWFKKLAGLQKIMATNNLDARMFLRTGQLEKAKQLLIKRLQDQEHNRTLPQTHRETEIILAYVELCLGNGQEAKRYAQKGIEQGIKSKNIFVEACGWMRLGHANQILNDYDPSLSEKCYLTALELMEKIHVSRGKAEPNMGLCILYSRRGEFERALEIGKLALYETENVQDQWLASFIRLSMGIASYQCGRLEDAKNYFEYARDFFKTHGDPYGYTLSLCWLSFYYLAKEDWENFKLVVTNFLQEVQLGNYEFLFSKPTQFSPKDMQTFIPLLMKAKELDVYPPFVQSILQSLGYNDIDSHPGYTLRVKTFGGFEVYLGDRLVTDKDWQRGKAKELFQFLLIKRESWYTKEQIYDQLWPDTNSKNIEKEFKVILNACNRALEPNRKARSSPFYIYRRNNMYGINPKAVIEIDYEQFEHWIKEGLREKHTDKAISLLLQGLHHYKGRFMEGTLEISLIENLQTHFQTLFLRGAEKLAQLYVESQEYDEAIFWCEEILTMDRTWEEAYRLLMYCHYQKNNRNLAIQYYEQCCKVLEEEYGFEPMESTKQMYEMIIDEGLGVY